MATEDTLNKTDPSQWDEVLIILDPRDLPTGIGDCIFFYTKRLRALKAYLQDCALDIYTTRFLYTFLKNNPFTRDIQFEGQLANLQQYDKIFILSDAETEYKEIIDKLYPDTSLPIVSMINWEEFNKQPNHIEKGLQFEAAYPYSPHFSTFEETEFQSLNSIKGQEIYISQEEKQWGEDWLTEHGLSSSDKLIVMLDNSSNKKKLLRIDVYFDLLTHFMEYSDVKILVFDENNIGKEEFYLTWLGQSYADKLIFVKNNSLREAICLLASDRLKLIFGPCTGLLHCISGIYNVFQHMKMPFAHLPIMIAYAGIVENEEHINEWMWWGESLVDAIYIEKTSPFHKEIKQLTSPDYSCLPASEYESLSLIQYLKRNYSAQLRKLGVVRLPIKQG